LTTAGNGSISDSHCSVVSCPPGSQLRNFSIPISPDFTFARDGCQYCSRGSYQSGFNESSCLPCGDGFTTLVTNASTPMSCLSIRSMHCGKSSDCLQFGKDLECACPDEHADLTACTKMCIPISGGTPVDEASQLWWISLLIAFFVLVLVLVIVLIVWRKNMFNCCCSLIPPWLLNFFPERLKSGMRVMRVNSFRRSRPSSMISNPEGADMDEENKEPENISLPRLALKKSSIKTVSDHSGQEEETCLDNNTLDNIRNNLREFVNEPEPSPLLHRNQEQSIRQRLQSPKTAEVGLRVQTSHHLQQNRHNFEHVKKENGHSIKTSSYSKQGVQNNAYSISLSQNINSNPEKEVITGPPVLKWLQDKLIHDSQKNLDQSLSMQADQRTTIDASPDWPSFNQFSSTRRSSSSNSDDINNPTNQFKSFESNNKNKVDEYFNKTNAFSRNSISSAHRTGSFYTQNTRTQPNNLPNSNNVDDDPDAFFS
jgi:hypothetical protein